MIEFTMPTLGADMEDGTLVEWKKKPGDLLKRGDIIAEVETQKGLIEIEVFEEGIVEQLLIKEGTKVPVGTVMALIEATANNLEEKSAEIEPITLQPTEEKQSKKSQDETRIKISPLARKIAIGNHVEFSLLEGTGPQGAITKEDVEKAITAQGETVIEESAGIAVEKGKRSSTEGTIRSAVAAAMSKSNKEIPHYYLEKKIDLTKALAWLKQANEKRSVKERILPVVLLLKATATSLKEFPDLNAIWDNGLQQKKDINIGFVVSMRTGGIIVPAIHQVDLKNIDEIMKALNDIIPRARALKLRSSELSESSITVTSIGEGGADAVFGIIYPPQVAIIGFGTISEQAFAENGLLGIRSVVQVTLAGDHRATDGLTGSKFLASLNKHLQNPDTL
ncbi:dihydrolipoamide acetyltransferase family protein [Flavobacterium sp. W22_SRS_FP1]|uniref:dihydrolipoamide acetyltransferase family protein n=1 Tax=Flavobacterium sp. W22_SRS_FP1 TaxID=3240276 RepID=UPI003F905CCF